MFLPQVVDEMMRSVDMGEFGGGHGEETWRSFLARAFAEEIAGQGGTGIARSIEAGIAAYREKGSEAHDRSRQAGPRPR